MTITVAIIDPTTRPVSMSGGDPAAALDPVPAPRTFMGEALAALPEVEILAEYRNATGALLDLDHVRPDVWLVAPPAPLAATTAAILAAQPDTAVAVLCERGYGLTDEAFGAMRAGARGYLFKDTELQALHDAIHVLAAGGALITPFVATRLLEELAKASQPPRPARSGLDQLTGREREILEQVAAGWRNQEIANHLNIVTNTVKVHLRNILEKLTNWENGPGFSEAGDRAPRRGPGGLPSLSAAKPWPPEED